jgi:hypothetical protein
MIFAFGARVKYILVEFGKIELFNILPLIGLSFRAKVEWKRSEKPQVFRARRQDGVPKAGGRENAPKIADFHVGRECDSARRRSMELSLEVSA